ncbi:hypothetical protein F7725_003720 [Dissostichus mawsoni]|uniref:Scaffolding anchor of CK1 domain-containing protein n=1 Tax=Dissostichus mawsoni TaxID=36200 RepID=A0A7J5YAZ9_DISMA|nr:hypothetical protein F7725_003720 [Dissostichus mawsoni]
MALSQLQCLDDNHVNLRTTESKPEFLYSEDQRVALEAFLRDGREAFVKYLEARTLRGFLSDLELDSLADTVEPYDPGTDIFPEDGGDDQSPLSLHYWPELSDRSIPQMDLAVYTQPPLDDQAHIKEVVRKMIAQAQKVIAVVMDVFTDVDIFRDLLDAGFKRKVSVYILLESSTLPHFRSMCQRAQMHAGHLKNLRVRCTDGAEFYTRSCTKIRGRMGHRFIFTWSASRLDRNLITVVTGQAVESFDKLFRVLYATSNSVDLRKDAIEPEPEAEPIPAPAAVVPPSAEMVRKLYSAKYVALGTPPPKTNNPEDSKNQGTKKHGGKGANKESTQEAPPIHPGLIDLEKVCMMSYLPTWPEPDPASDVIGFINIRDNKKQNQVHLQRSEMYETSQAVRFSSPFSRPKETLPDVAKPRDFTNKQKEVNELQPAQDKTKTKEVVVGVAQQTKTNKGPSEIKSKTEEPVKKLPASGPQCESNKDTTTTPNTENKQHSNTFPKQDAGHTTHLTSMHTLLPNPEAKHPLLTLRGLHKPHKLHVSITTSKSPKSSISSSSIPPLSNSSTTLNPALPLSPASPSETSTPPIPKPRTVHLVIKGDVTDKGQKILEVSVVPMAGTSTAPEKVINAPAVATTVTTLPQKVAETVPELQNNSEGEVGAQKMAKDILNMVEAPKQKQSWTSQNTNNEKAVGGDDRAGMQLIAGNKTKSDVLITKVENVISTHTVTHNKQGNPSLTPERPNSMPDTAKHNTHNNIQEKPSKAPGGTHTPEKPLRLHLSEIHTPDLLSPTSERGLRSLMALTRSPTPDGFLPRTPTPDFCTPTSDSRAYTPDFRTPTPDGYLSPRTDSALSTTSEEFYECCDSPFQEPVLERLASLNHAMTEEHISLAHTNNANATSPVYINSNSSAGTLGTIDRYTSSTETESLERKRSSTGDIQPTKERPDTEKAGDSVERMGRPQATDGQKLSFTSPEFPRGRQQAREVFSSYRPSRPSRVLSPNWAMGPHPSRKQNQAESNVLPDNAFFPRRPPSRPLPPLKAGAVGPATRQAEVSQSQQRFFSRQPPAAQDRTRAGQTQNPSLYPKPQGSFLLPQSNREVPLHSQTQNQAGSPQEEGKNPFSVTFSRLYSLKGLKEKMSRLPSESKRGSGSSYGQRHSSMS